MTGEPETAPAVPAATVLLIRDGPEGVETLLLERHLRSDFMGGAYVFPGGKVDPDDERLPAACYTPMDLAADAEEIGVERPTQALGLRVAAIRETFEEAGVLLARRTDGAAVTAADLTSPSFMSARRSLASHDDGFDWQAWLVAERLVLDLGALAFWSWWVTPDGMHKRFDTRFFVAEVPAEQAAVTTHDEMEITDSRWLTPDRALAAQRAGEVVIIFPTRRNLAALADQPSAAAAVAAAREGRTDRRRIQPRLVAVGQVPMVQHPYEDTPHPV